MFYFDDQDFTFDTSSCPRECECMATLADCGETGKNKVQVVRPLRNHKNT